MIYIILISSNILNICKLIKNSHSAAFVPQEALNPNPLFFEYTLDML